MRLRVSLRTKLFGAILLAGLAPVLAAGWVMASASADQMRSAALEEVGRAGVLARTVVEARSQGLLASAQLIALAPPVGEAVLARDRQALLAYTSAQMERLNDATVAVVDEEGTVLARAWAPDEYGDNVASQLQGLQRALRGQPGYSMEAAGLRGLALRGFAPITVAGQTIGAVVVAQNFDQQFPSSLREKFDLEPVFLLPDGSTAGAALDPAVASAIRARGEDYSSLALVNGREQALYVWKLADQDGDPAGFLGVAFPLDLLETTQTRLRDTTALAELFAVLGAVVLAWLLSHIAIDPLGRIAEAARAIAEGEEREIPHVGSGDELEELSRSLATMVSVLSKQARRLTNLSATTQRLLEEVQRERTTLAGAMANMSDGLVVLDAAHQVRYSNAHAVELLGVDAPTLNGQGTESVFAAIETAMDDPAAARAAWERALARPEARPSFEVGTVGPPSRQVLVQLFPVRDAAGAGQGVGLVLRDVTAERELQRTKDELVSVVSHELRTPLASLVGFAELLLTRDYPEAQRRQFLTVMRAEGQRLTALINDFLDLQRMESGRQQIISRPTDLRPVLEQALAAAGEDPERPIQLEVQKRLPPVQIDSDRILQVLANLLSNARKYSPAGGEVQLTARQADGMVEAVVRDQGLGIPPEALPRLFGKFYRVDNTDRRAIKGTGLGLAIAKQIVEAHGGRIWAESAGLGHGASFGLTLPLAEQDAARGDVLVVEDDVGFARLLVEELAAHGLSAVRVTSAEAALEQVAEAQPHAVVLDLVLPGLSGEWFLTRLREGSGASLPVVVVTVKDLSPGKRRALERQGVPAVLQKGPGVATSVAEAVGRALERPAASREVLSAGRPS